MAVAIDIRYSCNPKPPGSLAGAPYLEQNNISIGLSEPLLIFRGSVLEGARHFLENVNVSVAVSLAGMGPEKTMLEVWADPTLERNTHKVVANPILPGFP